jgi:hypothetical protein
MSDFVEHCRGEWRRLGVPDALAEEMAADLTSDLEEAKADGISAQELLGNSAFDPRSFARSWAAERGIIPEPPSRGPRRRPFVLVAFTAVAALAVLVAALLLLAGEPTVSVSSVSVKTFRPGAALPRTHLPSPPGGFFVGPGGPGGQVFHPSAAAPVEWILLILAIIALGFAAWLWASWGRSRPSGAPAQ